MRTAEQALRSTDAEDEQAGQSSFSRSVLALLDHVEYRRCESGEDIEAIYRLRYDAYRRNGFLEESASQMMTDELDDAPNCYRFGVFIDRELVSTVRIHHITQAQPFGPIMSVFGDVLRPRLALPYRTLRLAVIANTYFNSTNCVCVIREEHTAFYLRIFGSRQVGQPRPYPPFTVPVMLYDSECALNMERTLRRFPFFRSTAFERRMLFAKAPRGELAPLTILPTAKYFSNAA